MSPTSGPPPLSRPGAAPPTTRKPANTAAAKAAARAAAAREEEERRRRAAAVAAAAHMVHAAAVLLQVLDAGAPELTAVADDDGRETVAGEAARAFKLPPTGSLDRLLLTQASRLAYALATVVATSGLTPSEVAFMARPVGGTATGWQMAYALTSPLPPLPEFGDDAVGGAAGLLGSLWDRLPLLRTPLAHVVATTALAQANQLGEWAVAVSRTGAEPAFSVQLPEEVVQARYFGVVLARLDRGGSRFRTGGGGGATTRTAAAHTPLAAAVDGRLRASHIRRIDGVTLASCDVEEFDVTLI